MALLLYIHYPFCKNKCSYGDFYTEPYQASLEKKFYEALKIETELAAEQTPDSDKEISTIFVGGGTLSLSNPEYFADWLNLLKKLFIVPDGIEFSLESNPESITLENLKAFKKMGMNRPIFGVQSFNTRLLKTLGRRHNPHFSQRAIYYANALEFKNFGVELIFGLPGQTSDMLSDDIDQLIDLDPPHISFYQLTVKKGTEVCHLVISGKLRFPGRELLMAMYRGVCRQLADAGYIRYEASSFARPGFECRHHLGYWQGSDYLGLGPSAYSFMNGKHFCNRPGLLNYFEALKKGRTSEGG